MLSECIIIFETHTYNLQTYKPDHGEQHVKKIYSTVVIDKRGHALKPVRGYSFTGEVTNTRVPWLLKNKIFFNKSIYISFLRTLIYNFLLMGNSHIIGDFS